MTEADDPLTAREQRSLARNVQKLSDALNETNRKTNTALSELRNQAGQLKNEVFTVPDFKVQASRELELYNGRDGELFSDWLERFGIVAQAQNWDEGRKAKVLPAYLRGTAFQAYINLTG